MVHSSPPLPAEGPPDPIRRPAQLLQVQIQQHLQSVPAPQPLSGQDTLRQLFHKLPPELSTFFLFSIHSSFQIVN